MSKFDKVTHCIFDLDGLLINSEPVYQQSIRAVCKLYGKELNHETTMKTLGTTEHDTARITIEMMELPIDVEEFNQKFWPIAHEKLADVPLMPGAEKLIQHLNKNQIPIAVATSSSMQSYMLKTEKLKHVFNMFHHVVCGSTDPDVKKGKPAPDIFLVCASRFDDKPNPKTCLVFEDAPNGSKGAIAAGMQAVQVPDPKTDRALCVQSTLILDSLEQFKPEEFGLPPYSKCC